MEQLLSLEQIRSILPTGNQFYSEYTKSLDALQNGDKTAIPVYRMIHGLVGGFGFADRLSNVWETHNLVGGKVIMHKDFLAIQDDFAKLEGVEDKTIWDSKKSIAAFEKYIGVHNQYRQRHERIFARSLQLLPPDEAAIMKDMVKDEANDEPKVLLVAIPFHTDNIVLWTHFFGISNDLLARIPKYSKITESGLIFASKKHRKDDQDENNRGHDYFSYAYRAVKSGEVSTIADKFLLTAQHEGSHRFIDLLIIKLLNTAHTNPVYEGFIGALSEDNREYKTSKIKLSQLLDNPSPQSILDTDTELDSYRIDANYAAGPKFFKSVYEIMKKKLNTDKLEEVWANISASMLHVALNLHKSDGFVHLDENTKLSRFMKKLIQEMQINNDELDSIYESLNPDK
ncbi:MAG: hypothetical protein AAB550_01875 [Patescibacteria group bacterium]